MGYRLNRLDEPVFMAVPKPMLTELGIHYRLESCDWFKINNSLERYLSQEQLIFFFFCKVIDMCLPFVGELFCTLDCKEVVVQIYATETRVPLLAILLYNYQHNQNLIQTVLSEQKRRIGLF